MNFVIEIEAIVIEIEAFWEFYPYVMILKFNDPWRMISLHLNNHEFTIIDLFAPYYLRINLICF